jgi:hypothetical protein
MRFRPLACRITLAAALALALALTAACSSSSSSTASTSTSSSSAPASSSAAASSAASSSPAGGNAAAVAAITANWEKFFSASTPVSEKVKLLQNGSAFSAAISGLMSLVGGLGAKVTSVTVNSPTSATVTYNLTTKGSPLLSNQTGTAVYVDGVWKVGDTSLCGLLKLVPGGSTPTACSSAG